MTRLPEACEVFIASLEKAYAELEWIAGQLEEQFASKDATGGVNPLTLVQRIHRLQSDVPAVATECEKLLTAKTAVVVSVKDRLQSNVELLDRLQRRAGLEPGSHGALDPILSSVAELEQRLTVRSST
jgi:hypothetical protein